MRPSFLPLLLAAGCIDFTASSVDTDTGHSLDSAADTDTGADTEDTSEDSGTAPTLEGLKVSPGSIDMPTTRAGGNLSAEAQYSDGSTRDVTAECAWSSGDEAVAFVASDGSVHGIGVGSTTATCAWKGESGEASVAVQAIARAHAGEVVINELLADPATGADPNNDGNADASDDEFVELVNAAAFTVDLAGATLWDSTNVIARHTFAPAAQLVPGSAIVVFGGGTPNLHAERCSAVPVTNEDVGLPLGLALNNDGDTLTLKDADGAELAAITYDGAIEDASNVLDPEIDGSRYTHHSYIADSIGAQSPCTLATGASFPTVAERLTP